MPDTLILKASFELRGGKLILSYEVENRESRDAYLLNILQSPTPFWNLNPDLIYIHVQPEKSTVWLHKRVYPIPSDRNVLSPVAPFVAPLRSGRRFSEEVHIPMPVEEYREYSSLGETAKVQERVYKGVFFTLGYFWSVKGIKESIESVDAHQLIVPKAPPGARLEFGELTSPVQPLEIPVLAPA